MNAERFLTLRAGERIPIGVKPQVMGILNVTPDSFSDGGKFDSVTVAVDHARTMFDAGADWIDIGGESTRPGAVPVPPTVEQHRVLPVIDRIARLDRIRISIDTRNADTARLAVEAGAALVNDVSAGAHDPAMFATVATLEVPYAMMHMRGTPATMNQCVEYSDVAADVQRELMERVELALTSGIAKDRILIDPGIGFAKTPEQSYRLLKALPQLVATGYPVLIGCSRKRLIGFIDEVPADHRLGGSIALASYAVLQGAAIVRVHDVAETRQAVKIAAFIRDFA